MRGRSLTGVLTGSPEAVYDANDLVAGEMGNGKWVRQGEFKAVSIAAPYGSETGRSTTWWMIRERRVTLPKTSQKR